MRALVLTLGSLTAFFCLWGSWEIAGHVAEAPQALVGVIGFGALALVAAAASVLGVMTER